MAEQIAVSLIIDPAFDARRAGAHEPGLIVRFENRGEDAVDLDLFDTLRLEFAVAGGEWGPWSHGRNATRPGPHRELIEPGGMARRTIPCTNVWTDDGWTLEGGDWAGTRWWFGPVAVDEAGGGVEVRIRAVLQLGGDAAVQSEAVRLPIH